MPKCGYQEKQMLNILSILENLISKSDFPSAKNVFAKDSREGPSREVKAKIDYDRCLFLCRKRYTKGQMYSIILE